MSEFKTYLKTDLSKQIEILKDKKVNLKNYIRKEILRIFIIYLTIYFNYRCDWVLHIVDFNWIFLTKMPIAYNMIFTSRDKLVKRNIIRQPVESITACGEVSLYLNSCVV